MFLQYLRRVALWLPGAAEWGGGAGAPASFFFAIVMAGHNLGHELAMRKNNSIKIK